MTPRLPWQRNPEGGYIAYPEGEHRKTRRAEIRLYWASDWPWRWWVLCDDARESGHEKSRQIASDRANEAWPRVKERGLVLAIQKAEAEALATNVRRMMSKGDLPLSIFGIEKADSKKLTDIIAIVKNEGSLTGLARELVEACSAELFRRRTEGR